MPKQHRCVYVLLLRPSSLSLVCLFTLPLRVRSSRQCVALRCAAFHLAQRKRERALARSLRDRCAHRSQPAIVFGRHMQLILRVCAALSGRVCVSVGPRFHTSYTPTHSVVDGRSSSSVCCFFSFISFGGSAVSSRALVRTHQLTSPSSTNSQHTCVCDTGVSRARNAVLVSTNHPDHPQPPASPSSSPPCERRGGSSITTSQPRASLSVCLCVCFGSQEPPSTHRPTTAPVV